MDLDYCRITPGEHIVLENERKRVACDPMSNSWENYENNQQNSGNMTPGSQRIDHYGRFTQSPSKKYRQEVNDNVMEPQHYTFNDPPPVENNGRPKRKKSNHSAD